MNKKYSILLIIFILILSRTCLSDVSKCVEYFNKGKFEKSFHECKHLALSGNTDAINHIAFLNLRGLGVKKDINKAIDLYKIAAKNNNSKAQNNLGIFYLDGKIITQDLVDSAFWFTLASIEHVFLKKKIKSIRKLLNNSEINELDERIAKWERYGFDEPIETDFTNIPFPSDLPPNLEIVGTGTGFYVTPKGELLTNYHVAGKCKAVTVIDNNKRYIAKLLNYEYDEKRIDKDLALLKINYSNKFYVTFQNYPVKLGQEVLVAGYPLHFQFQSLQTTPGIISALSAYAEKGGIQFTAPIQPGNSGGPIFSNKGRVLGVVVASSTNMEMVEIIGRGVLPQNLNFGIKNNVIKKFLSKSTKHYKIAKDKKELNTEELAEISRFVTKLVECWK